MSKILILATYPIKHPQHGGQRRVHAIVEEYQKIFSKVKFVSVFYNPYYKHHSASDIAIQGKAKQKIANSPFTGDVICGKAIYDEPAVKKKMTSLLRFFKPDVIEIEQIFPYMGLKPLLAELGMKPTLISSTHNIEYRMKEEILENAGYAHEAEEVAREIKESEKELTQDADLVIAVSEQDATELREMGGKNVIVAPNGIGRLKVTQEAHLYWNNYKRQNKLDKLATFVGSAHPPNWFGFEAMVGNRMGFIPTDARLILAGGISDYFRDTYIQLIPEHATFWKRVMPAGKLSDELLAGLIDVSDVLLLPITEGGGSNLKTAEAILSGKKIVATTYAFRSFEEYLKLPNIYIADAPAEFRAAILRAFSDACVERTAEEQALAEKVQWQYCLQPMIEGAKNL